MNEQWSIGAITVTKVPEMVMPVAMSGLLDAVPDGAVERHPWLRPHFVTDDGAAILSIHALVVDTGRSRILVDTCIGNDRRTIPQLEPLHTDFLERLGAAGYPPESIDTVVCTHLHFDHVGWNTRLVDGEWVVTFPNARYLFGRAEWDHWKTATGDYVNVGETVRPIIEAGQADLVESDHQVTDAVRLTPTPGHTPGHVSVVITSDGARAVITGDMAHHPLQFAEPDIGSGSDSDSSAAAATRRKCLAEWADGDALIIGTHFASPTAGRIERDGAGYRFVI